MRRKLFNYFAVLLLPFFASSCDINHSEEKNSSLLPPVPPKQRLVGIAYTNWHSSTDWKNTWGTPELGCYTSTDREVIRQHAQWLYDAGVDFVWVDWSNNVTYIPGQGDETSAHALIERSTHMMFEEYSKMKHSPKISIFIGVTGAPESAQDGRLQRKADQLYRMYVSDPKYRKLLQDYLGKPLLVVYVDTPTPWTNGTPDWNDDRFTVRWMTGFVTEQKYLCTDDLISQYGYWSWEDRGKQTYTVFNGHPEAMVVTACWRKQFEPTDANYIPAMGRRGGETFKTQWARACEIGPKFAMVVSWNEWVKSEQPSVEVSKDIEQSKEFGRFYLDLLKEEISKFKTGKNSLR